MENYGNTISERLSYQYREAIDIEETAQTIDFDTFRYITCLGTQPSRIDGKDHIKCGRQVSIKNAFKCLYCNFWFCKECAEIHFGKTIREHELEMIAKAKQ